MNLSAGKILKSSVALFLTILFCGSFSLASASSGDMLLASFNPPEPGHPAPDFELKDLDGKTFSLSEFKAQKPVLLYFWATWCPHCVASRPRIAKLREEMPRSELEILGINVGAGDSLERLKRFQKGHPVSWPMLYDEDEKVTQTYQVQGIPLYILVNKEGVMVYRSHELPNPKDYLQ